MNQNICRYTTEEVQVLINEEIEREWAEGSSTINQEE